MRFRRIKMFQQKKNNDGRRGAPCWLKSRRNNEGVVPRSIVALCGVSPGEKGRAFFSFYHSLPLGREASVVFAWAMLASLWAGGKRFMGRRCSFSFLAKGWFSATFLLGFFQGEPAPFSTSGGWGGSFSSFSSSDQILACLLSH